MNTMKEIKLTSPTILSPKGKLPNQAFSEIFSSLKHHRCLSSKLSPYENTTNLDKLRTVLNLPSMCKSPKFKPSEKPEPKPKPKKKPKSTQLKTKPKKHQKREKIAKLVQIADKDKLVAPKIYENQIFTDVYDLYGNHDRIMEISQSFQDGGDDSVIVKGKLEILNDIDMGNKFKEERQLRPPENSYLEETEAPNDIHSDLLQKLNKLALAHNEDY